MKKYLVLTLIAILAVAMSGCLFQPTPTPAPTKAILTGQVVVPQGAVRQVGGQALPGATVNIIDPKTGEIIATTTTDANGNYQAEVPPGGPYIIEAVKDNLKVLDVSPQVEVGQTYDLGTADATSTAVALVFQAKVEAGEDPAQINLDEILEDPKIGNLIQAVEEALAAGEDPTTLPEVEQIVDVIVTPPSPTPTPTTIPDTTPPTLESITAYVGEDERVANAENNWTLTWTVGETVTKIEAIASEPVRLAVDPAQAVVTMSGGSITEGTKYGTIAVDEEDPTKLIITPYENNKTAALAGEFTFTVAAGVVEDLAGNKNKVISVTLEVAPPEGKPIYNETKRTYYATIEEAIGDAAEGDSILLTAGNYTITDTINIGKAITIKGAANFSSIIQTSGGNPVFELSAAATLDGIFIRKTDKADQSLIKITANNVVIIKNCKFIGQYNQGDGEVVRAILPNAGVNGYTLSGNYFENVRQPAYLEGTGTVENNFVKNTRGWVVCVNYDVTFIGNTFEDNAVDIAIIENNQTQSDFYTNIAEISRLNNGAHVENQLLKASAKNGNLVVEAGGNEYINSIKNAINAAVDGDTICISSGNYDGFEVDKPLTIVGEPGVVIKPTYISHPNENVGIYISKDGSGTVIEGVTIDGLSINTQRGIVTESLSSDFLQLTVKDSTLKSLTTGIYLNPGARLIATGNTIEYIVAGIGSEKADLTGDISGNTFKNFTSEAIGLYEPIRSDGTKMTKEEAEALASQLAEANGLSLGDVKVYGY